MVGNFNSQTSNDTNSSSGYSASVSSLPKNEPPIDYGSQISRQCGRGGLGYYDNVGNSNLRTSNDTNSSSGYSASVSSLPKNEPPIDYGSQISRQCGRGELGYYDNVGNSNLRTSNDTNSSSGYSASVSSLPKNEPPIDYGSQISRQCGRGGLGYHDNGGSPSICTPDNETQWPSRYGGRAALGREENRPSRYTGRAGLRHLYGSDGYAAAGPVQEPRENSQRSADQQIPIDFTRARRCDLTRPISNQPYFEPIRGPSIPPDTQSRVSDWEDPILKQRKSCNKKKFCYYIFVIFVVLGISSVVAFSTMNRLESDKMESLVNAFPEMLQGQDEELTKVNHTVLKTATTFKNALNSMRFEVHKFQNESYDEIMETMQVMFEGLKTDLTEYINKTLPWGTSQGGQVDGRCKNGTMGECVTDCYNICNGDFQSCTTCSGYVTCANRNLYNRPCPGHLVWDDTTKTCEATSNTCNILVQGTAT